MESEFEELLTAFFGDAEDHLEAMETAVNSLACDMQDDAAIAALFRAVHTLKGDSGVVGLPLISQSLHSFETELDFMRKGQYELSDKLIDPLRHIVDEIAFLLESTRNGDEVEVNFEETVSQLATYRHDGVEREVVKAPESGVQFFDSELEEPSDDRTCHDDLGELDNIAIDQTNAIDDVPVAQTTDCESSSSEEQIGQVNVRQPDDQSSSSQLKTESGNTAKTTERRSGKSNSKESIKVDRDRLDKLINVIGELIIDQSMVGEDIARWQAQTGNESVAMTRLTKTIRDLQELSLSLRMVPIAGVFQKMARTVRDLGRKLGKQVEFITEGEETELDKSVVDKIGDPLLHMVRNAIDHGIEKPEDREGAGKPTQGTVTLRAFHRGGNIFIEIQDDGKGIDRDAIRAKAISQGIVEEGETLTDQETLNLVFASGFSTAAAVTDVSGRGVGMDVVRRNVESLQGSISLSSVKGEGSKITIRLPLTLAILDGLSIRVGHEVYIVPILSVVESFQPMPADIQLIAGASEVVMVRDEVVPLLRLSELLNSDPSNATQTLADPLVVIVEEHDKKFALLVDELLGKSQVVIKNLETNYQKVDGIAGATIMGNGRIAMIIDVYGLVALASRRSIENQDVRFDEKTTQTKLNSKTGVHQA